MTDPQQPAPQTPPVPPAPPIELTFDPPAAPPAAPAPAVSATDPSPAPTPHWSAAPPPPANFPSAAAAPGSAAPLAPALSTAQPVGPGYAAPGYAVPEYGAPAASAPQSGATGYAAPTGAYAAPVGGYAQGYPAPAATEGAKTRALGMVALIIALVAAIGTSFVGAYAALEIGRNALTPDALMSANAANVLSFLSPVRDYVLMLEISFWAGTALGIWALVQGIVATVKRRGRGMGIGAIILAVLGPVIYSMIVWIGFFAGAAIAGA